MTVRRVIGDIGTAMLMAVALALTYQYQSQYIRAKTAEALAKRTDLKWHTMIDGLNSGIIVVSAVDGNIQDWNIGAERVTGYPAANVMNKPFANILPPAYRGNHWMYLRDPAVREQLAKSPLQLECSIIDAGGNDIPVQIIVRATADTESPMFLVTIDLAESIQQLRVGDNVNTGTQERWSMK